MLTRVIGWLPVAQLLLAVVIVIWNLVLAGRIALLREAPRGFATITGLAGLMLVPALLAHFATSSIVTGRAIRLIDWLWPLVLVLFAGQALYAMYRRLVNPTWGIPIAIYDVTIAMAGLVRYLTTLGFDLPDSFTLLLAAQSDAMALASAEASFASPLFVNVPMLAPAFPALRELTAGFRAAMAAVALGWLVLFGVEVPRARTALASYATHRGDRLLERPAGDFQIGVKLFPDLAGPPPSAAIRNDIALADTLGVDAVTIVLLPDISNAGIDSLASALELLRRDTTLLIVALGYRGKLLPEAGRIPLEEALRLEVIRRVVRRLRPHILLPAEEPYHAGARLVGRLSVDRWRQYLTTAARVAKQTDRRVRIGFSASAFDARDSALYAWAAAPGSPVDVVGFSFFPTRAGMSAIDARTRAADRWMRGTPSTKPHWVFGVYGYPLAHGERSQESAIWGTLAWATARDAVKGIVIYEAGDYGLTRGLRAPTGRLRSAGFAVMRAVRGLREVARP